MMPSTPYLFLYSNAFCGLSISPLPKMGMLIRGLFFTLPISSQSACPLYICVLVRPCMASALMPTSCNLSATSSIFLCSSSQPNLVLTVTGNEVDLTTAAVNLTIRSISLSTPAPAPFIATFFTGQPKFISSKSGLVTSTIFAAKERLSSSPPKICIPTGFS